MFFIISFLVSKSATSLRIVIYAMFLAYISYIIYNYILHDSKDYVRFILSMVPFFIPAGEYVFSGKFKSDKYFWHNIACIAVYVCIYILFCVYILPIQ
jgi:peptidoglycan/LPS O-acetylase OafA/YrhL